MRQILNQGLLRETVAGKWYCLEFIKWMLAEGDILSFMVAGLVAATTSLPTLPIPEVQLEVKIVYNETQTND
jgi:hypothetical protein